MIPIQDLLHRIQWDPVFGKGDFEIGYVDRVAGRIVRVPFREVRVEGDQLVALTAVDEDGGLPTIPLHRVREVWRGAELIWQRPTHLPE